MSQVAITLDTETYPNCFLLVALLCDTDITLEFEISNYRDDSQTLFSFLCWMRDNYGRAYGFNLLGFDGPLIQLFMRMHGKCSAETLYQKAQSIINAQDEDRFQHLVYPSDRPFDWVCLYRLHHFDNKARSTSLKLLEVNMLMESVKDLPFKVGLVLNRDQIATLRMYCRHDVKATELFRLKSMEMVTFREELAQKYPGKDWLNLNDTAVGKSYFIMQLENAGVECYTFGPDGRTPKQTPRPTIALKDAIPPWITFQQPEFNRVLTWLKEQVITETRGVFTNLTAEINGFTFVFGLGGIHGSVEREKVVSDDEWVIVDIDIVSMYPSIAIAQRFYPEHMGEKFCDVYADLKRQRVSHKKGTSENATLKLALNGVYGDSNNKFSVFYDPLFTMKITLNGQLFLCMLAEKLMTVPTLRLIQCNTDGITMFIKRDNLGAMRVVCDEWMQMTGLQVEEVFYSRMWITNVNNYLAEYVE